MDKNAIKKYAVWARRELIMRVSQKAYQYGIREDEIIDVNADSIDGKLLSDSEKKERQALIVQVKNKGFEQVMEEVAYTWFNRFSALRFMEVNGYLPSHVRVFTDDENKFKPQIITEAIHLDLDGLDMDKVYELKEINDDDELFKYLLITQCNALNEILPGMFQRIADYTELLFPDNLLREGSVIEQIITLIPEEDWKDAVQIIGWLYQFYNSEPKDIVFANLKKKIKISKENIPAATQLFTPDWIVRYMVENSLGRLWLEGHPNDDLKEKWDYYLDEAEQEADVQEQLNKIRKEYELIKPEDIKIIDPCMGSGHILVYAFDVLMQIYEAYGYNQRDAVKSIVENNIYGLDIDDRAAQLAYFAVMMKARQYDRRFFSRQAQPHVYAIRESNYLDPFCVDYFTNGNVKLKSDIQILIDELHDAKEYGSILNITAVDFDAMYVRFDEIRNDISIHREAIFNELLPLIELAQAMAQNYDVVVTNPPYMGNKGMNNRLSAYVKKNYNDVKMDMFACCMDKAIRMINQNGFVALITMESWMFLSSFKDIRCSILKTNRIISLVHMPYLGKGGTSLGINFGTVATVINKAKVSGYISDFQYVRYYETDDEGVPFKFPTVNERKSSINVDKFKQIPSMPVAYWVDKHVFFAFKEGINITKYVDTFQGIITGDNKKFLRLWFEPDINKIALDRKNFEDINLAQEYWIPYNKGGEFRNWYGNQEYVVYWKNGPDDKTRGKKSFQGYYLREYVSWSYITSSTLASRYFPCGFLWDVSGSGIFDKSNMLHYLQSLIGSKVGIELLKIINPTINYQVENIAQLPVIINNKSRIDELAVQNIALSKTDWDSFENSWRFQKHPLITKLYGENMMLKESYTLWRDECQSNFNKLWENEQEINRIFIETYQLYTMVVADIDEKDVTIRKANLRSDIESLVSYAVGCMFGRYSLDIDGLVYAGGDWDATKYKTYPADEDNVIPICDDEYFRDDIMGRFIKFIETVYGKNTLEENLEFIAEALGGKGSSRDVIRNYFINNFYRDHCKMYQKRPIYWLFDSGKKNGFKALIYMHRYQPDTIARMRTDYVHEQQERYRTAIAHLDQRINHATTSERVKLNKKLDKLKDQETEIRIYEEKIHHLADQMIAIDLDDGIKENYKIFKDILAKIR